MIEIVRGEGERAGWWVDKATGQPPVPGDMFYAPFYLEKDGYRLELAPKYWALPEPRRAPIVVILPPRGRWFCVDSMAYEHPRGFYGEGWTVTGEPPLLTVTPSINAVGDWHGWLTNGELVGA